MAHLLKSSSSIEHIDYHDDKDTLEIKFSSGAIYHYKDCEKDHFHALKGAASAGAYFQKHILGKYKYEKAT